MALIALDITSYDTFRTGVLDRANQNLGFDVDGYYGYQCWDLAAELWMNIPEFSGGILYPQTGPLGYAEECWTMSRDVNAGMSFDLVWHFEDVKRGDCIVIGSSALSTTGHIAFADEDYNSTNYLPLLGQNQVSPDPYYGHIPTVTNIEVATYFLGAFRYKAWGTTPPHPPTPTIKRSKFPWYLIQRRARESGQL